MPWERRIATQEDIAIVEATPLDQRITETSTYDLVVNAAQRDPQGLAVSFQLKGDPKSKTFDWTFARVLEEVTQAANLFHSLGAHGNSSVALLLPNLPETLAALFAGQTSGIVNPINPLLEPEKIASILRDSDAKVLVTLKAFPKTDIAERAAEALALAPGVTTLIEIDMLRYVTPPLSWIIPLIRPKVKASHNAKVLDWAKAVAEQPGDRLTFAIPPGGKDRVAAYFHTGGTTGDPKLAQHHIGGILYQSHAVNDGVFGDKDTILCCLPLFHCFGAYVMGTAAMLNGGRLVLMTPAGFRGEGVIDNFWKLVEKYKVNFFMGVPTALAALNQREVDADVSTLNYCVCGSAPLPVELFKQFESKTGIRILEGYGQTEATVVCSVNPPAGERKIGSVGFPLPYTKLAAMMIDGEGKLDRVCEADEIGELCIAGPHVFPGYKGEDKNRDVFFTDGEGTKWLRSGDLGRKDAEGYFWITGRAKDLIIRGGHNIDPGMIEEVLATHPAVAMVGAIGQPDAYAGEIPCAYVELNEGMSATPEEMIAFAEEHVPERAARPVYIEVMEALPVTAVGKIFKPDLRKSAIRRVFIESLAEKGIEADVTVEADKLKGMVAVIDPAAGKTAADVAPILDRFAVAWRAKG